MTTSMFPQFEALGNATGHAERIRQVTPHNALFDEFTVDDLKQLGPYMQVHRAPARSVIISEGDKGDFMIFIIEGQVDVTRRDRTDVVKRIAVVLPGQALGAARNNGDWSHALTLATARTEVRGTERR